MTVTLAGASGCVLTKPAGPGQLDQQRFAQLVSEFSGSCDFERAAVADRPGLEWIGRGPAWHTDSGGDIVTELDAARPSDLTSIYLVPQTTSMKIAILNYADVRNFGDVLFPMIVVREISARIPSAKFEFVTPTGSSWGGMESIRLDQVQLDSFNAILLGGGEIVHRDDNMLAGIYSLFGLRCIDRPTDLVFSWTRNSGPFKAWLALGVPPLTPDSAAAIFDAARSLDFISVRGSHSAQRILESTKYLTKVRTSPDLGWIFPRLLENSKADSAHPADGHPYIAVQSVGFSDPESTTTALKRISRKTGLKIVLLPLTRCWQDVRPLRTLYENSEKEFFIVDDAMSDLEKLSVLGRSSLYLGQSMHGFIGTLSQCRPAGLLLTLFSKFGELLSDANLLYCQASGWEEVERLTDSLLRIPLTDIVERKLRFERELDEMFDSLCVQITGWQQGAGAKSPPEGQYGRSRFDL